MADMFRSNNPVLKESAFAGQLATGQSMTIQGTVNKTGLLLLCVVVTSAYTWGLGRSQSPGAAYPWMLGGAIGGFVAGFGYDLQEGMVTLDSAALRAARRTLPWRHLDPF